MKKVEMDKIEAKPLAEVKRRIRAALSEPITAQEIRVDNVCWNGFHSIKGTINTGGDYILTFDIAKAIR